MKDVELPDGSTVEAFELDIALHVMALRGSVPSDAGLEFRKALSKYGRFKLRQKGQLLDIYEELKDPRSATVNFHAYDCILVLPVQLELGKGGILASIL